MIDALLFGAPSDILGDGYGNAIVMPKVIEEKNVLGGPLQDPRSAAPGQKFRIVLDALDEIEHLLRAVRHQYRLVYAAHCYNTTLEVTSTSV